jgi:hypothetical protein
MIAAIQARIRRWYTTRMRISSTRVLLCFAIACTHAAPPVQAPPPTTATVFDLPGAGNGVFWDDANHALYLTDGDSNQVVTWLESGSFAPVGVFAPPSAEAGGKVSLGGLLRIPDGTFVSPAFGFGTAGGINVLSSTGSSSLVPNLDPSFRRIAIARAPDAAIYETFFTAKDKQHDGGIARVELGGVETVLATGLGKPVGIAATADTLFVADQDAGTILAYARADAKAAPRTFATGLPSCDQLTLLPNGDLVTGGKAGAVYRVTPAGAVTPIASGFAEIRGSAYDPTGKRLFFVEHRKAGGDRLHILPLP